MSWKSEFEEFLSGKTEGEVFEKSTISNFLKLMNKREIETLDFPISISIGSAVWDPRESASMEEIQNLADQRMYEDKRRLVSRE